MKLFLLLLATSDLVSAYFLMNGIVHPLIVTFLWIHSVKGFTSLFGSIASGYYFDWMGLTDISAALLILLMSLPFIGNFFKGIAFVVGIIMGIKGIYSLFWGFF